jgi:UTP--glucose-1-phosphate uridylyltransferase
MTKELDYLIIPAAGLGTRMRSVKPDLPKEMLPLGNRPVIQYAVAEGISAWIRNIVIIINRKKDIIREYFEDEAFRKKIYPQAAREIDEFRALCTITFLYQEELSGESDAILLAESIVGSHPVAILYPDNVYLPAPGALKILSTAFHSNKTNITALMEVTEKNSEGISNSGRVDLIRIKNNIFRIERFIPKGDGYFVRRFKRELRTCGFYVSDSRIFGYIRELKPSIGEIEFTDGPVRDLMLKKDKVLGCLLPGTVFDIGNPTGYELCMEYLRSH